MKLTSILLLTILALFRDSFVISGESSVEEQPQIELASKNDDPSHFFRRAVENRDLSHYHGHHGHHGSYPYPPYRGKVVYIAKLRPNTNDDHVEVIRVPPRSHSYPPPKSKGKSKGKGGKGGYGKGKGKGGYGKGKGKGVYGKGKGKGGYGKGGKGGYAGYGW
jgi:hypothetical protein